MLEIKETYTRGYTERTKYNAVSASVTIAMAFDMSTPGEKATRFLSGERYIGVTLNKDLDIGAEKACNLLLRKLHDVSGDTVNIAGNGIYTCKKYGVSQEQINQLVFDILSSVHSLHPIKKIYSGGQTGLDIAGAAAAYKLQIPCEVTLPKGFIQRDATGKDSEHSKEFIENQIKTYASKL